VARHVKQVLPGKVWSVDRRTTRRYFLFKPDEQRRVENLFWYCLAVAAAKHGIVVHAACLMSSHIHLVYTDVHGVQPRFKAEFHRLFANGLKVFIGWPEEVFKAGAGGEHEPLDAHALVEDIAYVIANPASALAVRYAKDWPGAQTLPGDIGRRVIRATRPTFYFNPRNPNWPPVAELRLEMPEALEVAFGVDSARRRIADKVRRLERKALGDSKEKGIPFRGVRRVLRVARTVRARAFEAFGKINPRFRAAGNWELARSKVRAMRLFEAMYAEALARWTAGERRVLFPSGTWWMRVHHGARCHPPP
jgi:putative transposase